MKYEIDNCEALTIEEVIDQLTPNIEAELGEGEHMEDNASQDASFIGGEIEVPCMRFSGDYRVDGKFFFYVDIGFIRKHFTIADYITFAKDENGDDALLCFM